MPVSLRLLLFLALLLLSACQAPRAAAPTAALPFIPPPLVLASTEANGTAMALRMVDPLTLRDVPDRAPIELRSPGPLLHALSQDGRQLAVLQPPGSPEPSDGELLLLDLEYWKATRTTLSLSSHVNTLIFGADNALYWFQPTRRDPAHGVGRAYALLRMVPGEQAPTIVLTLPEDITPGANKAFVALRSGKLALYGLPTDQRFLAIGPPQVLIIDPAAGRVVNQITLDGLRAGQLKLHEVNDDALFETLSPGLAWDVPRDRLYVTHPDGTAVTLVDLAAGTSRVAAVAPTRSLLERIGDWLVPTAHAKMVPDSAQQAVLSDDGSHLYITGRRLTWVRHADGTASEQITFAGLRVITTADMREMARHDLPVDQVALAPGGRTLLLTGTGREQGRTVGQGLFLLPTADPSQQTRLAPDGPFALQGFSADGRIAYVVYLQSDGNTLLQALTLADQQVIAERVLPYPQLRNPILLTALSE
jgi:hypothetical protein